MEKMKDLCSIKATLVDSVKEQLSHGIECVDAHEMGEVVDMIPRTTACSRSTTNRL